MLRNIVLFITILLTLGVAGFAQGPATPGPTPLGAVAVAPPVERADAAVFVQHSHTSGATITIAVGAAGSTTQFAYITGMDITNCQGASAVTAAAPTFVTTTGFNGGPPQYMVGSGSATAGLCTPVPVPVFTAPLRSAQGGVSPTFVLPAFATNQTVSVNIYYRLGSQ